MTKIIAIANQKGGVGKTTTAVNIAAGLVQHGFRVLCTDFDPQGNLSNYLGYEPDGGITISELLTAEANGQNIDVRSAIRQNAEGVDYIPSNIALAAVEPAIINVMCREQLLRSILNKPEMPDYDYAVIDCLPSLGILLTNALTAADSVMIPVQAQKFALDGLAHLNNVVSMVKAKLNPALEIEGVLVTMYDKTNMSRAVEDQLANIYGEQLFGTRIRKSVEATNSTAYQQSLVSDDRSRLGSDYKEVVNDILIREVTRAQAQMQPIEP